MPSIPKDTLGNPDQPNTTAQTTQGSETPHSATDPTTASSKISTTDAIAQISARIKRNTASIMLALVKEYLAAKLDTNITLTEKHPLVIGYAIRDCQAARLGANLAAKGDFNKVTEIITSGISKLGTLSKPEAKQLSSVLGEQFKTPEKEAEKFTLQRIGIIKQYRELVSHELEATLNLLKRAHAIKDLKDQSIINEIREQEKQLKAVTHQINQLEKQRHVTETQLNSILKQVLSAIPAEARKEANLPDPPNDALTQRNQ